MMFKDMGITRRALAIGAMGLALGAFMPGSSAQAQSKLGANFEEILAGAKKEGKLVVWNIVVRSPEAHRALIEAFNKKFNLSTQLEWVPNPPVTSNTRAIAESAGGSVSVDLIGGGALEEVSIAANAKLIKKYNWTDVFGGTFPVLKELEARMVPEFRGLALPFQTIAYGICWNPNMIADADVPAKFSDLTDAKWQGKFAFNAFLAPLTITAFVNGPEATTEYTKKLFANKPIFERGTPAVARAVVSGTVPFGVTVSPIAESSERLKEPLKFKLFTDVIPVTDVYVYVPENSPNPNTARLFAAWLVAEGSAVGDKFEPMARPGDKDTKLVKMIAETQAKAGAKIADYKSAADIDMAAKLRDVLLALLAAQPK